MIDVEQLDSLLHAGYDWHWLIGERVIWHDDQPHEMKLLAGGRMIGLEITLDCEYLCGCKSTVYTRAGLHSGAWCYAYDVNGNYVANLRDQSYLCQECEPCQAKRAAHDAWLKEPPGTPHPYLRIVEAEPAIEMLGLSLPPVMEIQNAD